MRKKRGAVTESTDQVELTIPLQVVKITGWIFDRRLPRYNKANMEHGIIVS